MSEPAKSNDDHKAEPRFYKFSPLCPHRVAVQARTFSLREEKVRCAHLFFSKKMFFTSESRRLACEKNIFFEKKRRAQRTISISVEAEDVS